MQDRVLIALVVLLVTTVYVAAPALLALACRHPERRLIYKLCPLTLLSFILWVALIAWAVTGRRDDAVISRYVSRLRGNNHLALAITVLVLFGFAGGYMTLFR